MANKNSKQKEQLTKYKIRENFRKEVFDRDNWKCLFCSDEDWKKRTGFFANPVEKTIVGSKILNGVCLDAHHIMDRHYFSNGGYVLENGITLCPEHHHDAEQYHISNAQNWIKNMHPDDLYKMINSNFEKAIKADEDSK